MRVKPSTPADRFCGCATTRVVTRPLCNALSCARLMTIAIPCCPRHLPVGESVPSGPAIAVSIRVCRSSRYRSGVGAPVLIDCSAKLSSMLRIGKHGVSCVGRRRRSAGGSCSCTSTLVSARRRCASWRDCSRCNSSPASGAGALVLWASAYSQGRSIVTNAVARARLYLSFSM